jgi:hypothetical protein
LEQKYSISEEYKNKPGRTRLRHKLYIFLLCLVISAIVWLFIKLSKEYSITLEYPVRYSGIPEGYLLRGDRDTTLSIYFSTKGFNLLSSEYFRKTAFVDLYIGNLRLYKEGDGYTVRVVTESILSRIEDQLGLTAGKLLSIDPDTLRVSLIRVDARKVPVVADLRMTFRDRYHLYDSVRVTPDSVSLNGTPPGILDIPYIKTVRSEVEELDGNRELTLDISRPSSLRGIDIFPTRVKVFIPVEEYTETSFELPLEVEAEDAAEVKTYPDKITLTCLIALKDYQNVKPSMFRAAVTLDPATAGTSDRLKVEIRKKPDHVIISRIDPPGVEYLIIRK